VTTTGLKVISSNVFSCREPREQRRISASENSAPRKIGRTERAVGYVFALAVEAL
jgi:hypothetical protein